MSEIALYFNEHLAIRKIADREDFGPLGISMITSLAKSLATVDRDDTLDDDDAAERFANESAGQFVNEFVAKVASPCQARKVANDTLERWRQRRAASRRGRHAQALQVRHAHGGKLHPHAQAVLHQPIENFDKLLRKGATDMDFSKVNKAGVLELMNFKAEQIRKAEPRLTKEQAFTKYVDSPEGSEFYRLYKRAPAQNVVPLAQPIRKIAQSSATAELQAKGEELRKSEPRLTSAQAFARVATDPANRELFKRAKGENPYEPLDAA